MYEKNSRNKKKLVCFQIPWSDESDSILSNVWSYGKGNQNLLIEERIIQFTKQWPTKLKIEHHKHYFKFMLLMYLHGEGLVSVVKTWS